MPVFDFSKPNPFWNSLFPGGKQRSGARVTVDPSSYKPPASTYITPKVIEAVAPQQSKLTALTTEPIQGKITQPASYSYGAGSTGSLGSLPGEPGYSGGGSSGQGVGGGIRMPSFDFGSSGSTPLVRMPEDSYMTQSLYNPNWLFGGSNPTQQGITASNIAGQATDIIGDQLNANANRVGQNARFSALLNALGSVGGNRMTGFRDVNSPQFGALPGTAIGSGAPSNAYVPGNATTFYGAQPNQPAAQPAPQPAGQPSSPAPPVNTTAGGTTGASGGAPFYQHFMGGTVAADNFPILTAPASQFALQGNPGQNLSQYTGATTGAGEAANYARNLAINGTSNGVQPLYTGATTGGQEAANFARNLELLRSGLTTSQQVGEMFRTSSLPNSPTAGAGAPVASSSPPSDGIANYTTTITQGALPGVEDAAQAIKPPATTPKNALQQQFADQQAKSGALASNAFSRDMGSANAQLGLASQQARAQQGVGLAELLASLNSDAAANDVSQRRMLLQLMGLV